MDAKEKLEAFNTLYQNYGSIGNKNNAPNLREKCENEEWRSIPFHQLRLWYIIMAGAGLCFCVFWMSLAYHMEFDPWPSYDSVPYENICWCVFIMLGLIAIAAFTNVVKKDFPMFLPSSLLHPSAVLCSLSLYFCGCLAISSTVEMSTHLICAYFDITRDLFRIHIYALKGFVVVFAALMIYCLPKEDPMKT